MLYCWPCGEVRHAREEEKRGSVYYIDEAGRCYDEDMYQKKPDGGFSPELNNGGGQLTWLRTIWPSLQEGWRPKEPMSAVTRERVLHVLASKAGELSEDLREYWTKLKETSDEQ